MVGIPKRPNLSSQNLARLNFFVPSLQFWSSWFHLHLPYHNLEFKIHGLMCPCCICLFKVYFYVINLKALCKNAVTVTCSVTIRWCGYKSVAVVVSPNVGQNHEISPDMPKLRFFYTLIERVISVPVNLKTYSWHDTLRPCVCPMPEKYYGIKLC